MTNPTRERIGTVVDANGVALTVNRDMALTEITLEAMADGQPVGVSFIADSSRVSALLRMLNGKPPGLHLA